MQPAGGPGQCHGSDGDPREISIRSECPVAGDRWPAPAVTCLRVRTALTRRTPSTRERWTERSARRLRLPSHLMIEASSRTKRQSPPLNSTRTTVAVIAPCQTVANAVSPLMVTVRATVESGCENRMAAARRIASVSADAPRDGEDSSIGGCEHATAIVIPRSRLRVIDGRFAKIMKVRRPRIALGCGPMSAWPVYRTRTRIERTAQ